MADCCLRGIRWDAQPKGEKTTLGGRGCYISGSEAAAGIMLVHDMYGWTFNNIRLLADHFAEEVKATVYVPDFFGGEVLLSDIINDKSRWGELDLPNFLARNTKPIRTPEIIECAKLIREKHTRTGAMGYCYGGWAVFELGAKGAGLVDCISTAHPTHLTKEAIEKVSVAVQILAPEHDPMFTPELKEYSMQTIPTLGVPFDYQHFPGIEHGFAVRGNPDDVPERNGMERAKNAAVSWFRQWLRDS